VIDVDVDLRKLPGSVQVVAARDGGYFPVVLSTGPNEAIAAIRGGASHIGIDGRVEVIRTSDGGRTWTGPRVAADSDWDDRNPSLGLSRRGTVVLAYHHQGNYDSRGNLVAGERVDTLLKTSADKGETWSEPYPLDYEQLRGRSPYGRMLLYGNELLLPIYGPKMGRHCSGGPPVSYIIRSSDSGLTWNEPSLIAERMNETSLALLPGGEIIAILRSELGHPASLYCSVSSDGGSSWTKPRRVTRDSEHPGDVLLLSNGWVLVFFGVRHEPYGVQGVVSTDMGATWVDTPRIVVTDELETTDCGYPSATVFGDGTVVVMYYSAGRNPGPRGEGAYAKALVFKEEALIAALEERGVG